MLLSITAIIVVVLPFSLAQSSCTLSNAVSWSSTGNSSSGSSGSSSSGSSDACNLICEGNTICLQQCNSDPCAEKYADNPPALAACEEEAQQGECNSVGGSACDGSRKLRSRAAFTCTSSETCYEYMDGSLFCLDESTGTLLRFVL